MTVGELIKRLQIFSDDWEVESSKRLHLFQPNFRGMPGQKYGYLWHDIIMLTVRANRQNPETLKELGTSDASQNR